MATKRGRPVNIPAARKKLNELFFTWLGLPETQKSVRELLSQCDGLGEVHPGNLEGFNDDAFFTTKMAVELSKDGKYAPKLDSAVVGNTGGIRVSPPRSPTSQDGANIRSSPPRSPTSQGDGHYHKMMVDEWDRMKSKVASPPSSPKPQHPPHSPTAMPPAPLSPHGPRSPVVFMEKIHYGDTLSPHSAMAGHSYNVVSPTHASHHQSHPFVPSSASNNKPVVAERPPTSQLIPKFWNPDAGLPTKDDLEREQKAIAAAFRAKSKAGKVAKPQAKVFKLGNPGPEWIELVKTLGFPGWWSTQVFSRVAVKPGGGVAPELTLKMLKDWWEGQMQHKSMERRFFDFLKNDNKREHLTKEDFAPFIQDLLRVHPGLEFLKQTPEFQEKYAETVVVRIFYTVNRSGNGKMTFREYSRSRLHDVMLMLDNEDDINNITEFFSYEHFYVLYCKFWELDLDHDFYISMEDLLKYNNYALTETIVNTLFTGVPRKLSSDVPEKMNYEDFIWFCLSEEDKTTDTGLEYWFRCIDLDRDGIISGYEIDYYFAEQKKRMDTFLAEQILFDDILCQMIDMINPKDPKYLRLSDLKACPTSGILFNVLFNLNKFIAFEQRDPFQAHAEKQGPEKTDWDRFARIEYDRMALEAEQSEEFSDAQEEGTWSTGI